ncbi:hypothetical protein CQ12_40615 [Bradyrhizobium jicamae]|uniref:Uncharacterized protein n=1 Tax=Bradyrhizobium jicamae TaxID=280332 RepID=A0A0R3M082_9BRAD|nr:hypothetical protein CQ12_40615 [Bradyrhizobium jicamae]
MNTISFAVFGESNPFVRTVPCRTLTNTLSIVFDPAQMSSMLGRELKERERCLAILDQALGPRVRLWHGVF